MRFSTLISVNDTTIWDKKKKNKMMGQYPKRHLVKDHALGKWDSGFSVNVRESLIYIFSHFHSISSWGVCNLIIDFFVFLFAKVILCCENQKNMSNIYKIRVIFVRSVKADDMKMFLSLCVSSNYCWIFRHEYPKKK